MGGREGSGTGGLEAVKPSDIANDERASGYDHVGRHRNGKFHAQVYGGKNNSAGHKWQGPVRATALEAAQDYCDYAAGKGITPAKLLNRPQAERVARDPIEDDRELSAALGVLRDKRAQRQKLAQGYVYLISDGTAVKVGYSVKPEARVRELQTGSSRELRLLGKFAGSEQDEARLHQEFFEDNLILEWFKPSSLLLSRFGLSMEVFLEDAKTNRP